MIDEQVFNQAIQLEPGERERFLSEVCSNSEQRMRVAALIAAHETPDSLLDTEAMAVEATSIERPVRQTIGDFEIIRELGRGGMGVVYEARQKSLKRRVALKVLSSGLGLSSKAILRFRREAEAAGKLHHTNIVPIYTTGEDKGIHYYAMELIDGPSLDAVIKDLKQEKTETTQVSESSSEVPSWLRKTALYDASGRAQDESDAASVSSSSTVAQGSKYFDHVATMVAEVADALEHAHEHGVIHRDIKPSNLLLAPDGRLSVNDFGLARMLEQPGMTMSGEFVGSPLYMSPEQITAGRVTIDHRTDIYSLGATLYELLTLRPPFPGQTRDQVLSQILHKEAPSPRKLNRKIPTDLDTICTKAIDKDPDRRYQTAGQLANDLNAYVHRHAISARRVGPVRLLVKYCRRNPVTTSFATFVIFVVLLAGGFLIRERERNRVAELGVITDQLYDGLFRGDATNFDELMGSAERLGATEQQQTFFKGLRELLRYDPDYEEAHGHFTAILESDPSNISAKAMLAHTISGQGDEIGYLQTLSEIAADDADEFEEALFLGYASQWGRPRQAYELLGSAHSKRSAPFVNFQLGAATRLYAVSVVNDLHESKRLLDLASVRIDGGAQSMPATSNTRGEHLLVRIDLMRVYEALARNASDHDKAEDYQRRALVARADLRSVLSRTLEESERPNKFLALAIVHAMIQLGDKDLFDTVCNQWSNRADEVGVFASQLIALHLLKHKEYEQAGFWFQQSPGRQTRKTQFIRHFIAMMDSQREISLSDLRLEARNSVEKKLRSDDHAFMYFDGLLLYLLGDETALSLVHKNSRDATTAIITSDSMEPIFDYLTTPVRDASRANQLLSECENGDAGTFAIMHANYCLGIEALASGKVGDAKRYFEACTTGRQHFFYVYHLSQALLAHENRWKQLHQERIASMP